MYLNPLQFTNFNLLSDRNPYISSAGDAPKFEVVTRAKINTAMETDLDQTNNDTQGAGSSSTNATGNANAI
ncbi:hypothetical protein PIROE2DRAFT_2207 [Piromyces sp. E2]|nr:hypothetical protein PIROE2DRAFT_2207 [Piromyces sp. E2]|eukprot:OUM69783.1 hypothetical protein PIROE2DRAFT_2207 [Piromyces sp. E2]